MNNTKYEKLYVNDWWRHSCIGQLHKPLTPPPPPPPVIYKSYSFM